MDRAAFEHMYLGAADPYGLRTRWYEARKRAILLASLPRASYASAFEPGCGIGVLTRALALRCGRVLASDFSAQAVAVAREGLRELSNVEVVQQALPGEWPRSTAGAFDLIVLSELGYFLDAGDMASLAKHCGHSLSRDGTLVACHWLPGFDARRLPTPAVHEMLDAPGLRRVAHYEDADFQLVVWERAAVSVAQREGIR